MTFEIGAKVIHPAYGAGEIVAIREKQFVQHVNRYYVINMPLQKMTVMVPTERVAEVGLRPVSEAGVFAEMWEILKSVPEELTNEHKQRQESIKELLRSGNILKIALAVRDLTGRRRERKLTQTDRGLLEQAENRIAGELALARDIEVGEALALIRTAASIAEPA